MATVDALSIPADLARSMAQRVVTASNDARGAASRQSERLARSVVERAVRRALDDPLPIADTRALQAELDDDRRSFVFGTSGATLVAGRLLRRFRRFERFASKAPVLAAASAIPEVTSTLADGLQDLFVLASYLVGRARAAGVEADPERVRRVAVQLLAGERVDADREPDHDRVLWRWVQRSAVALVPFGGRWSKRSARAATKSAARTAATVDPRVLGAAA